MASPNLSEIITTTLRNRSGELADNVSKGNPLLNKLKEKGGWKPATGRTIVQELEYAESAFQWFSGYELLNITPSDVLSAAEFNWKQGAAPLSISGLERDVQNTGKEAIINLLESRIKVAMKTLKNNVTIGMYSDGTGSAGKAIGGLQLLVADTPTSGTVGGIDRLNYTFWRNQSFDCSDTAATTAANIQSYMNEVFLRCTRGDDKPDMILADRTKYKFFWSSMQAIQRVTSDGNSKADAGFTSLAFANNVPVYYEDSTGIPSGNMYFLNTDYIFLRYAPDRLFEAAEAVRPVNQDAETVVIHFAGNMTCSNCSLQGVMKE